MRLAGAELVRRRSCRCRAVTTKQRVSRPDSMSLSARAMSLSTITKRGQEPQCGPRRATLVGQQDYVCGPLHLHHVCGSVAVSRRHLSNLTHLTSDVLSLCSIGKTGCRRAVTR